MQGGLYSLFFEGVRLGQDVFSIGISNPKVHFDFGDKNFFLDAPKRPGIAKGTFRFSKYKKLLHLVKKISPDIIYFESLHAWSVGMLKHFCKTIICFSSIHDVVPHGTGFNALGTKILTDFVYKKSAAIFLRSNFELNEFQAIKPRLANKAFVFPLTKTFPAFHPYSGGRYALVFGRINRYKGSGYFRNIVSQCPNVPFIFAGRFEDSALATELGNCPNVQIINRFISEKQLEELILGSFVCLAPYITATQSGVAVQCYALSRPIIAFSVGGLKDEVSNNVSGFLISPGDTKGFSEAINSMAEADLDRKNNFCKGAYFFGSKNYSSKENGVIFYHLTSLLYSKNQI